MKKLHDCLIISLSIFITASIYGFTGHGQYDIQTYVEQNLNHLSDYRLYNEDLNKFVSSQKGSKFSAKVFQYLVESTPNNKNVKDYILSGLNNEHFSNVYQQSLAEFKKHNVKLIVLPGLGWDDQKIHLMPYYVQDFFRDIHSLGINYQVLERDAYAPIEQNIESILPQLKSIFRNHQGKFIFMSLCKGSPELIYALSTLKRNGHFKDSMALGLISMSGMMNGTFFGNGHAPMDAIFQSYKVLDEMFPWSETFERHDRDRTIWSLPHLSKVRVQNLMKEIHDVEFPKLMAINISGIVTSNSFEKSNSPLIPLFKMNTMTQLYPYSHDGFMGITDTELPSKMFPLQKKILIEGSHLLTDGHFHGWNLGNPEIRLKFYQIALLRLLQNIP